jgi:hypothetical protein
LPLRDALVRATEACGVKLVAIPEKVLAKQVELAKKIAALGKSVGPPWGKDQKEVLLLPWWRFRATAPRVAADPTGHAI